MVNFIIFFEKNGARVENIFMTVAAVKAFCAIKFTTVSGSYS